MDAAEGGITWKAASVARSSTAEMGPSGEPGIGVNRKDLSEETRRSVGPGWESSQVEDVLEERDAMDWLEDDMMMRRWEEVSQEEEKITLRRNEGRGRMRKELPTVPQLMVSLAQNEEGGKEGEGKEKSRRSVHRKDGGGQKSTDTR